MSIHHSAPHDPASFVHHTHRRPLESNVQSCKHPHRFSPSCARGITSGKGRLPAGEQQPHVWDVLVLPKKPWRIITSVKHSTVWDGDDTLFDFNFQAMGNPPDEFFQDANKKMKKPRQHMVCHFAQQYTKEP
jgi:hypothetical protein